MAVILFSLDIKSTFNLVFYMLIGSLLLSLSADCVRDPEATDFTGFTGLTSENFAVSQLPAYNISPCATVYAASPVLLWARQSGCIPFRPHHWCHRSSRSLC